LCFGGEICGREADVDVDVDVEAEGAEGAVGASGVFLGGGKLGAAIPWVGEDEESEVRGA
jgi:hypothetical protein